MFVQCLKNSRQRSCLQYYHIHLEEKSQIYHPFHATVWINVELSDPSDLCNDFQRYSIGVRKCSELKRTFWDLVNQVPNTFQYFHLWLAKDHCMIPISNAIPKFLILVVLPFLHHCNLIPFLLNFPVILFWQTWFWF